MNFSVEGGKRDLTERASLSSGVDNLLHVIRACDGSEINVTVEPQKSQSGNLILRLKIF